MKNVTWNAVLKRNCDGVISACLKVKYKNKVCKSFVPDINQEPEEDYNAQLKDDLKAVFGKKNSKKIYKKVMKDFTDI